MKNLDFPGDFMILRFLQGGKIIRRLQIELRNCFFIEKTRYIQFGKTVDLLRLDLHKQLT